MRGTNKGMATTGKHFRTWFCKADHMSLRRLIVALSRNLQRYAKLYKLMPQLDALMPAHVIYDQVDSNPCWLFFILAAKYLMPAVQI